MGRVGGASAIATNEQLVTRSQAPRHDARRPVERPLQAAQTANRCNRFIYRALKQGHRHASMDISHKIASEVLFQGKRSPFPGDFVTDSIGSVPDANLP